MHSSHAPRFVLICNFYSYQKYHVEKCLIEEFRLSYWQDYFCHFYYPERNTFDLYVKENQDKEVIRNRLSSLKKAYEN